LRYDDLSRELLDLDRRAWGSTRSMIAKAGSRRPGIGTAVPRSLRRGGPTWSALQDGGQGCAHASSSPSSLPGRRALAPAYTRICLPPVRSTSIGCFHA